MKHLYIILAFLAFSNYTHAQIPPNDLPCGATSLTVGAACSFSTYTNVDATDSGVTMPGCGNYNGQDVWFSVVVPASGNLTFDTQTGTITDAAMEIYSGTCSSLTLIECDDDSSAGTMPRIIQPGLTAGETIWIRIWEFGGDVTGNFDICVYDDSPSITITNNLPCGATSLTVGAACSFSTYTNVDATDSGVTMPGCGNYNGQDVWFSVVVPASGNLTFDTQAGTITDAAMEIYSGTCSSLTLIECDDDSSAGTMPRIIQTGLTAGETIWIRIWEFGGDVTGDFDICVYDNVLGPGPCTGGEGGVSCADMQAVCTDATYCYSAGVGATAAAGNDYGCLGTQPNPSWYYFEISQAGDLVFDMTAASDIDYALWGPYASFTQANAACGSLSAPIDCSFSTSNTENATIPGVIVGETYVLVITNYANVVQDITMSVPVANTAATDCSIVDQCSDVNAGNW